MCDVCLCPYVCVHTIHMCVNKCLSKGSAVCIDTYGGPMEPNFTSGERVNWSRLRSRNKTPADKPNTEGSHRYTISVNSGLSSPRVRGHTLFHWMQLPLGRASVWDRSSPISWPTVHQIISSCTLWVCLRGAQCGYIIASRAYRPLIHYRVSYHHHRQALHPKREEETGGGYR